MISARYNNDRKSCLRLNEAGKAALKSHMDKLAAGRYTFETVACPVCGRAGGEDVAAKDRYGIPFSVVVCENCGLLRTDPRMNQESYAEFYGDEYRMLYGGKLEPDEEFFNEQVQRGRSIEAFLHKNGIKISPGELVVEVGCGAGGILSVFKAGGADVIGCDLGEEYLRFGRERRQLDLRSGFLGDLKLEKKAKLVIYSHVLEHILSVRAELDVLRTVLASDGVVYMEVPSVKYIHRTGYRGDFLQLLQNAHTYHFTRRSLCNIMVVNGYEVVVCDEQARGVFRPGQCGSWESDYAEVLRFLKRAEYTRYLYFVRPSTIFGIFLGLIPVGLRRKLKKFKMLMGTS